MKIRISFRGMDHSNAAQEYIEKALQKIYKFIEKEPEPIQFDVILEAHRQHHHHKVEIRMRSKHNHFIVEHEGPDLYREVDHVIKRLIEDIKRKKGKYLDKRNHTPDPFREESQEELEDDE